MIISCLAFFGQSASAQSRVQNAAVSIKFYDKTMYYPDAADSNPVFIHITVRNTGTDTLRFKLADDRMFSIDFNAYTIKNERLSQTETLIRKRTTNQTVYFREIALEAGEEYSFVENLKEYLTVANPSVYYVDLAFYPELYRFRDERISSNRLTLEVRPSPSAASSSAIPVEAGTVRIL